MSDIVVFDGGTGREIERLGGPFRQPEWSALALYEDPPIVQRVHESYIEAGAKAITTNSYAIVPFHIGQDRYERDGKRLLKLSVDLAVAARGGRTDIDILGSIPPLCGSYEPDKFDKTKAKAILQDFLSEYDGRVDVLLLETIGSVEEAEFYLTQIQQYGAKHIPIWLSFCLKTNYGENQPRLLTGQTLSEAIGELKSRGSLTDQIDAILVNCCDVRIVHEALRELSPLVTCRIGAYPNAFSIPPPDAANHTLRQVDYNITPEKIREHAEKWVETGASLLGGCCGVGPEHIRAMANLSQR